eukprot:gene32781-33845_t
MARFLLRLERRKAKVLKRFIKSKADWLDSLTFDEWLDSPSDFFMSVLADQQRKEMRCAGKVADFCIALKKSQPSIPAFHAWVGRKHQTVMNNWTAYKLAPILRHHPTTSPTSTWPYPPARGLPLSTLFSHLHLPAHPAYHIPTVRTPSTCDKPQPPPVRHSTSLQRRPPAATSDRPPTSTASPTRRHSYRPHRHLSRPTRSKSDGLPPAAPSCTVTAPRAKSTGRLLSLRSHPP